MLCKHILLDRILKQLFVVRANLVGTNHAATNTFVANGVTTKDFRTNVVVTNQNLQYMHFKTNLVKTNVVIKKKRCKNKIFKKPKLFNRYC